MAGLVPAIHVFFTALTDRPMRYPVPARFVTGWVSGAPITAQFLALPDDRKQAFIAGITERVAAYVDDAGLAVPMENHFLTASK
ncbi:MAG: hypothetical protein WB509_21535 [Acetobacteraceae bacterium]|jgi:hypothetical protein